MSTARPPEDLDTVIRDVYEPAGMKITDVLRETESTEYGACRFRLNGHSVAFRIAKSTPTKIGQFVTIWKRPTLYAAIAPLDVSDSVDFVVVNVSDTMHHGQFVFNQKLLVEKGIMSQNSQGGKLALRIYPPWTKPAARAAIKTQAWQLKQFFSLTQIQITDSAQTHKLLLAQVCALFGL